MNEKSRLIFKLALYQVITKTRPNDDVAKKGA